MITLIKKTYYLFDFLIYYFLQLSKSNIRIAYDILNPRSNLNPGFIDLNLKIHSDLGLLLFSNLISMTPGSLTINISDDKKNILIHIFHQEDKENTIKVIGAIENKIIRLTS